MYWVGPMRKIYSQSLDQRCLNKTPRPKREEVTGQMRKLPN
jgi:hypothetical protein